ncbi:hypothetical protein [Eikenella exigua]|uniref:hypothetical protein n=1 Tax=Eikenella exigua TaxID=2528037 RepID=UPI00129B0A57|nr:hypothetical protein [Eikenella exigua]
MALSTWLVGQWQRFSSAETRFARFKAASSRGKRCVLCHELSGSQALCGGCTADLHCLRLDARRRCPLCAGVSASGLPCGRCQRKPPPQTLLHAALAYRPPLPTQTAAANLAARCLSLPAAAANANRRRKPCCTLP